MLFTLSSTPLCFAQTTNPYAGQPKAVQEGASLFRANCSPCHGLDARGGGRGPDLVTSQWVHSVNDQAIFDKISRGVPGTEMPPSSFEDSETWTLVAFVRSVNTTAPPTSLGNRAAGERLFFGKLACDRCHMVKGRGGHLGPELSRVGASRSIAYLTESIREPSKELSVGYLDPNNHYGSPLEYDTVTVVTKSGQRLVGVAKNEDAFTIQLLAEDDELHLFSKSDLAEVRHDRRSLMPAYTPEMLGARELQDLLAYLSNLRGE